MSLDNYLDSMVIGWQSGYELIHVALAYLLFIKSTKKNVS